MYSSESSLITPSRSTITRPTGRPVTPSRPESISEMFPELRHTDARLLARVPLTDRDGSRRQCVAVHGYAERCARLVLPTVPAPDGALLVVVHVEVPFQIAINAQRL